MIKTLAFSLLILGTVNGFANDFVSTNWTPLHARAGIDVSESTLAVDGKDIPAVEVTFSQKNASFNNTLLLPIEEFIAEGCTSISFRVKLPENAHKQLLVALFSESWYLKSSDGGSLPVKKFDENSPELSGNELEITWDIADILSAINTEELKNLALLYNTSEIPEDENVTITIGEVTFQK